MVQTKHLFLPLLVFTHICLAWVQESEPNNELGQANAVACGDTVYCAALSNAQDIDHFRFVGTAGDSLYLLTYPCNGSNTNTMLVLFDENYTIVAMDENSGPGEFSMIRYFFTHTAQYTVRVMRAGPSPDGTYSLRIGCSNPPVEDYDLCQTARVITSIPYYNEGSTFGQTHQAGTLAPDVFYTFYNPVVSNYTLTVCADFFDARVQLIGYCVGGYGDDEWLGCNLGAVLNTYNLPVGQHYILVEGTSATQWGAFSLEVEQLAPPCPPPASVVLTTVGGYPALDWPEQTGPAYWVVWQSNASDGEFEHLGTTFTTFFVDSSGFASPRRFYKVTAVCLW